MSSSTVSKKTLGEIYSDQLYEDPESFFAETAVETDLWAELEARPWAVMLLALAFFLGTLATAFYLGRLVGVCARVRVSVRRREAGQTWLAASFNAACELPQPVPMSPIQR